MKKDDKASVSLKKIIVISLIAFIVGCLSIGILKSFLIIGIADVIFFL